MSAVVDKIEKIAEDYIRGSKHDYIGLYEISSAVRHEFGLARDSEQLKQLSLAVVRLILGRGLVAGDYLKSGFHVWPEGGTESIIARIDREWNPACGDPTLGDPICWFDLKQQA
jgi:hypothetical protein